MTALVQAKCPQCRQTLRIPADWMHSPLKCKLCGTGFRAKKTSVPAMNGTIPAPVGFNSIPALAAPLNGVQAGPIDIPDIKRELFRPDMPKGTQDDALFGGMAGEMRGEEFGKAKPNKKPIPIKFLAIASGGIVGVLLVLGLAVLVVPQIIKSMRTTPVVEHNDESEGSEAAEEVNEPGTPADQKTALDGEFPNRRALVIGVNQYLYFNPTLYGSTQGAQARNISTLMDRFKTALRIPTDNMVQLSDKNPLNPVKPEKQVIADTIRHFLLSARKQDCLLIMFTGHIVDASPGEGKDEEPCLVPLDGVPEDGVTLIPLNGLLSDMAKCPARQKALILDICRFNPERGLEFPGSGGTGDDDVPGAMWGKLDEALAKPPGNVQVWTSCSKGQHSYELELDFNNSVFLDALDLALARVGEGRIQFPEEPMPLEKLVELVNATMKTVLETRTKGKEARTQVSRLTGTPRKRGFTFDPDEPAAAKPQIKLPAERGGSAARDDLKKVLADLELPPVRSGGKANTVKVEDLPFVSAEVLADYIAAKDETPDSYKKLVASAKQKVKTLEILDEELKTMAAGVQERVYLDAIATRQKKIAPRITQIKNLIKELEEEDKANRDNASKRFRADLDFLKARLLAQLAYSFEATTALGAARSKETPPLDPQLHDGWRMAATTRLNGDREGKDAFKARDKLLKALADEHKGTPWEVLARRERYTALGVEWQPAKLAK